MKICGIILILLGCIALGYQGFNYVSQDVSGYGSEFRFDSHNAPLYSSWLPPLAGGLCILAGILMLTEIPREEWEAEATQ